MVLYLITKLRSLKVPCTLDFIPYDETKELILPTFYFPLNVTYKGET